MRWLALLVAALSLACLLVFADDSGATPRKKIVRRVLGCDSNSMRFLSVTQYSRVVGLGTLDCYVRQKGCMNLRIFCPYNFD